MRATRLILASFFVLVFIRLALAKEASGAQESLLGIPCAAFAQDGRWATANFAESALRVRLGNPSGETRFYDLPVVLKQISPYYFPGCGLFFSPGGRYLAASQSVEDGKQLYRLHIGVLDTRAGKWLSSFDVPPQGSMQTYLELDGFLQNTRVLVVTGGNAADRRGRITATTSMMYDLEGKVTQDPGEARVDPPDLSGWERPDAKNNRLWGSGAGTSTACHWRSVTLTGPLAYGPTFDEHAVGDISCGTNFFIAFPDANTIVGAGDNSNHNWVWRVDLSGDTGEKLSLPESRPVVPVYQNWYNVRRGSLSPDGQVFVVDRDLARDVFDRFYPQPDVLTAVQIRPLRVLGTVQLKRACPVRALAADHRNGQVEALIYTCGRWESLSIPPASRK